VRIPIGSQEPVTSGHRKEETRMSRNLYICPPICPGLPLGGSNRKTSKPGAPTVGTHSLAQKATYVGRTKIADASEISEAQVYMGENWENSGRISRASVEEVALC